MKKKILSTIFAMLFSVAVTWCVYGQKAPVKEGFFSAVIDKEIGVRAEDVREISLRSYEKDVKLSVKHPGENTVRAFFDYFDREELKYRLYKDKSPDVEWAADEIVAFSARGARAEIVMCIVDENTFSIRYDPGDVRLIIMCESQAELSFDEIVELVEDSVKCKLEVQNEK